MINMNSPSKRNQPNTLYNTNNDNELSRNEDEPKFDLSILNSLAQTGRLNDK